MTQKEKILKEAMEIFAEGKQSLPLSGKIIYDKNTRQFSIKIPKDIAEASEMRGGQEVHIVARPDKEDVHKASLSDFIIYGKTEEHIK